MTSHSRFAFRVLDSASGKRILVGAGAAFALYACCDPRAEVHRQAYLSAFRFSQEFREYLAVNDSTKGYNGPCWSPWLWFDIDNAIPGIALDNARRLVEFLADRYGIADDLLVWFSGGKGYHIGLPTSLWEPEPSPLFAKTCRHFAESVSGLCGVVIDSSIYDCVRLFRAPNSRHAKTGLFKRHLTLDELFLLDLPGIQQLAAEPKPFEIPAAPSIDELAVADWQIASVAAAATNVVRQMGTTPDRLNRSTRDFLRDGAVVGDRHRLLYSAARNLGEFGCSLELALALLEPAARESGLPPTDIRRQIECALADEAQKGGAA